MKDAYLWDRALAKNEKNSTLESGILQKIAGGTLIGAIPVGAGLAAGVKAIESSPLLASSLLVAYAILIVGLRFARDVVAKLRPRWVDSVAEVLDRRIARSLSRFGSTYLRHVRAANGYIDLHGLTTRGGYTLTLSELFVRLDVVPSSTTDLNPNPLESVGPGLPKRLNTSQSEGSSAWYWLRRAIEVDEALVIVGPPGSGKTTLLRHLAEVFASKRSVRRRYHAPSRIPVLISFRDVGARFHDQSPTLEDLIQLQLNEISVNQPKGWFERQLRRGSVIVLLDGLDELATPKLRTAAAEWAGRQQLTYPNSTFVVTSRPFGYKNNPLRNATVLQMSAFSIPQITEFILRSLPAGGSTRVRGGTRLLECGDPA